MKKKITCSIVGARGYAGLELSKLLLAHPNVELKFAFATSAFDLSQLISSSKAASVACKLDSEILNYMTDVVFLATPAEVSMELAPKLLAAGAKVIDLSGAFRLKFHGSASDMKSVYGFEQSAPAALAMADYGLVPFAGPTSAKLIANPGCYATAIEMALIPLVRAGLVKLDSVVIDAKSGSTGAGKKASENLLFTEVDGECLPYKVGRHQHYPEIQEAIALFAGGDRSVGAATEANDVKFEAHMTTSLLPVRRGITAGIYCRLSEKAIAAGSTASARIPEAYAKAFEGYGLVSVREGESSLLQLKRVVGTGRTHISFVVDGSKLYLFSCIDNLLKGAASQAVENLNRLSDLPVETGLGNLEALK